MIAANALKPVCAITLLQELCEVPAQSDLSGGSRQQLREWGSRSSALPDKTSSREFALLAFATTYSVPSSFSP